MSSESERDQVIAEGWEIIAIMEEAVRRFRELPPRDPRPGASRPSPGRLRLLDGGADGWREQEARSA